jgi:hypothetical protein
MPSEKDKSKEYTVSVCTDDIHEAIGSVADALFTLVEEALAAHENHEAEECEFETFARDVLGVLSRHADQLSGTPVSRDDEDEASDPLYE